MKDKLYLKNWMSSNPVRTFIIVLIMAIVSALLFVSMYFSIGLNNSIDNMKQRLAAKNKNDERHSNFFTARRMVGGQCA
ncbi:MAG: hypothetical protein E7D13_07675 [Finegoldia magna]|nr:hypothetical protein [Finegoldia magna]